MTAIEATPEKRERKSHLWDRDPDNWYTEPAWVSARLFEVEAFGGWVWDPFAGMGRIIQSARAAGIEAHGTDLRDRGFPGVTGGWDFLNGMAAYGTAPGIVSNPPYGKRPAGYEAGRDRLEEEALRLALKRARKVAFFMDAKWLNSSKRGAWVETLPLARVWLCGPRPSCPPGRWVAAGKKAGNGTTDFSWFVFERGHSGPPTLHWLRRDG